MRRLALIVRHCLIVFCIIWTLPAAADPPGCGGPAPPNAPIPPDLLAYCTAHPDMHCDLAINPWDPVTHRSPDIRVGDPFPADPASASPERPRFFFDVAGNRYYTKLFTQITNTGGGPAPASEVTVDVFVKPASDPAQANDPMGWLSLGTYAMSIPPPPPPDPPGFGVLFPGSVHAQASPLCWTLAAGADFPRQFLVKAQIHWPAGPDSDPTDDVAFSLYDLASVEPLAQIAFAMDLSGSMTETLPGGAVKLTEAREKANLFANLVEAGNQLGAYGFATDNPANTPFTATYKDKDSPAASHTATMNDTSEIAAIRTIQPGVAGNADRVAIMSAISAQTAHGCTPVGQGLLRARAGLAELPPPVGGAGPPAKAIVLFSDGLQNVPPFINTPAPYSCGSGAPLALINAAHTFSDEHIQIYSIYFGPEVGWAYDLMNQIKEQTGGKYVYGAATPLQLAATYYAIRGQVDDMVYFEKEATTTANGPWPTFEVSFDSAVDLATVAVAWPYGDGRTRLTVDYRRRGTADWQSAPATIGGNREQAAEPASFQVFRFPPGPGTTWEFRVRALPTEPRGFEVKYTAAVFAAVEEARLAASLDADRFTVGQPLPIHAELLSAGRPVIGAQVTATVQVPARPFSTTLRKYSRQLSTTAGSPDVNRIPAMIADLKRLLARDEGDEGKDDLYIYRNVPVTLRDDGQGSDKIAGDGIYSGELPADATHVAGDYQVTITARATLPTGRTVERIAKLSTIGNVGPADPARSEVTIATSEPRNDGTRLVTVTVLPTDRFGNAAFPGSGHLVAVTPRSGSPAGGLVDNLDASFTQTLVLQPGEQPQVDVAVGGVALKAATGGGTTPLQPYEASFHLGWARPRGAFAGGLDAGASVGVDLAYRFNSSFALRGELARADFDRKASGREQLTRFNLYLQHRWAAGLWQPYFEAGLGLYDLAGGARTGGLSAGLGLQYALSRRCNLDFGLFDHRVNGSPAVSFTQLQAGILYKF
jgi:hypothetical protein